MGFEADNILKTSRNEKIKSLGYLCYNLFVDGTELFPEMSREAAEIKSGLDYIAMRKQSNPRDSYINVLEAELNDKMTELGCICYNLYIDKRLFPSSVLSLCDDISEINKEIYDNTRGAGGRARGAYGNGAAKLNKENIYPYGMEPIPANYKKCLCGYRNRPEAKYCARCGAKLHA